MKLDKVPLAVVLSLAIAAVVSGCAKGDQHTAAADATADPQAAHADMDPHAAESAADHADAVAHASGIDFPVPDQHVPWAPDAPLVEGMSRVRTAVTQLEGHPDAATVAARAKDVEAAVDYMFANCKLSTEPDVALHAILARLMAGTQALHANPADAAAVTDMHGAVENYERLFDDPNHGG